MRGLALAEGLSVLGVCGRMVCQVWCLRGELSLAGAATSIIIVTTKVSLSRPNFCRDKHNFVATKVLLRQAYFCRDKHMFVTTKHVFCHDKSMLVATSTCYSQQIFVLWLMSGSFEF